jgi:hypothetical protein
MCESEIHGTCGDRHDDNDNDGVVATMLLASPGVVLKVQAVDEIKFNRPQTALIEFRRSWTWWLMRCCLVWSRMVWTWSGRGIVAKIMRGPR